MGSNETDFNLIIDQSDEKKALNFYSKPNRNIEPVTYLKMF